MKEIPPDEYRRMMRELNNNQKAVVMYHRNWCKKAVVALRNGHPVEPYIVFMSGPGGVGKSHVIHLIHFDTLKLHYRKIPFRKSSSHFRQYMVQHREVDT